ncbi:MAG TPA: zinc-dependent alcohol dehydrogenase family protein [Polyangiales bacterium]|nr:zinc-dependent alcohol dehydrogenase family protein [Polyangiales bacterium]
MQAIQAQRHGGPEVLELVELPTPMPAAGQVLVRAHTIGVGKPDVLVRSGSYPWNQTLPVVPGHEMAGHVVALGEGVTDVRLGQAVLVIRASGGGYAEYAAVPVRALMPLPENMEVERAVGALNYLAAYAMLYEVAGLKSGQTLYFNGASGGVGTAVIQLANRIGATILAGASSEPKCAFARARGAHHVIDYSHEDPVARVRELTDGRGADLILDQFVGPRFDRNYEMLATFGQILVYNLTGGMPDKSVMESMTKHIAKCPALRLFSLHAYDDRPAKRLEMLTRVLELLASGEVASHVSQRLPLSEARTAHELLDSGAVLGKLLLKPPGQPHA